MTCPEFIRDLEGHRAGQVMALYRWRDTYVVLSTVPRVGSAMEPLLEAMMPLAAAGGSRQAQRRMDLPSARGTEETMAFEADANGAITDWGEITCARGPGSRERALGLLAEGEDLR